MKSMSSITEMVAENEHDVALENNVRLLLSFQLSFRVSDVFRHQFFHIHTFAMSSPCEFSSMNLGIKDTVTRYRYH